MRNPCLEIALRELEAVGIRDVEQVRGGKHWQLRWQVNEMLRSCQARQRGSPQRRAEIRRCCGERALVTSDGRTHANPRRNYRAASTLGQDQPEI